ncbi:MAG: TonB-dependent receptor [Pseudomonadota bacterium]
MASTLLRKSAWFATTSLAAGLIVTSTASAQSVRENIVDTERVLNKVEVTAQKKAEDLQDVPIAITTFDEAQLETLDIAGFQDLATFTPGLTASPNPADSSGLRLAIRGLGLGDPQIGLDATVGLYVNGVYIGKTPGITFDTPDLARIEVLKGPQGTLYGRNAVAGAINIITKGAEIGEFSGRFTGEVENFGGRTFEGVVNIPLGEVGALKLSGRTSQSDGFIENTGEGLNFGAFDRTGLTADLAFQPSDELRFEYSFEFTETLATPFFTQRVPNGSDPTAPFSQVFVDLMGNPNSAVAGRQDEVFSFNEILEGRTDSQAHRASARWDWSEDHQLKFIASYREADATSFAALFPEALPFAVDASLTTPSPALGNLSLLDLINATPAIVAGATALPFPLQNAGVTTRPDFNLPFIGSAGPGFNSPFTSVGLVGPEGNLNLDDHQQFSFELTQTGSFGDRWDYTFGLFYFDEDTAAGPFSEAPGDALSIAQFLPLLATGGEIGGLLEALNNPLTPPEAFPGIVAQIDGALGTTGEILATARGPGARIELDTQAFAAYGQVTWTPIDPVSITVGLRYSRDEKQGVQQGFSPLFNDTIDLAGNPIPQLTGDEVFDSFDPTVTIEYRPTDDILTYAKYSQAFRSGGFNQAATSLDDFIFQDENIRSFEVGFKSDILKDRVRLNGNVFYNILDDQQFTFVPNPAIPILRTLDNRDAEIFGFELEGQFVVSEYFIASVAYAFLETDADPFIIPGVAGAPDRPLPTELDQSPRNSVAVSLDYNRPVWRGDFAAHLGYNYKDATTIAGEQLTNQNLLDARVSYTLTDEDGRKVSLFFYGQNLADDEFIVDGLIAFSGLATATQTFGQPRTWGGGVTVAF